MYKQLQITFRNTEDATTKNIVWDIRDFNPVQKWAKALQTDYLETDAKIEKQFMLHGWVYQDLMNVQFRVKNLTYIDKVNTYCKKYDIDYNIDLHFDPATVDQDILNKIHHHFEILIGQTWNKSEIYEKFDLPHQFSVNNFNWLCHEIESQLRGLKAYEMNRSSSSVVICMKPIVRHDLVLENGDYDNFEMKDLEFGQIRMHYSQTGKTHREAWHDEDEDIYNSNISGIRYLSGEFDIHLNSGHEGEDWNNYKKWCVERQIDLNDKTLSLGWCVFGDINRSASQLSEDDMQAMLELWKYDDIFSIKLFDENGIQLAGRSWDYSWLDWYNQRKDELIS